MPTATNRRSLAALKATVIAYASTPAHPRCLAAVAQLNARAWAAVAVAMDAATAAGKTKAALPKGFTALPAKLVAK